MAEQSLDQLALATYKRSAEWQALQYGPVPCECPEQMEAAFLAGFHARRAVVTPESCYTCKMWDLQLHGGRKIVCINSMGIESPNACWHVTVPIFVDITQARVEWESAYPNGMTFSHWLEKHRDAQQCACVIETWEEH